MRLPGWLSRHKKAGTGPALMTLVMTCSKFIWCNRISHLDIHAILHGRKRNGEGDARRRVVGYHDLDAVKATDIFQGGVDSASDFVCFSGIRAGDIVDGDRESRRRCRKASNNNRTRAVNELPEITGDIRIIRAVTGINVIGIQTDIVPAGRSLERPVAGSPGSVEYEGGFIQSGQLFTQFEDMTGPVIGRVEPGEILRKGRIIPAPRQPGAVMHQAHRPQRLDQP